ncbi:hypothetical protein AB0O65_01670 [Microbacterium sp. NPDC077391]|uniref:Uncharacterized protein n=1 Tax=Microbacterium commune TaxID=2762219 RepID=A0ABR8W343_9MICO|nr:MULTISPECIES: hypothetical protein [Microbacterium]MBD8011440.1 hypothetical protein [Microbacterium commune]
MSAATRSTGRCPAPPVEPTAQPQCAEPRYELVDIDRYEVSLDGPVGYVEVIPPLFICYSGHPYPAAIEVAQVFDFEQAVRRVHEAAAHTRGAGDHGRFAA